MTENKEIEKRDKILLDAIKAGARIVEKGFGKVLWEVGKGNIVNTGQRMDYKRIWVFHCVSDLVAREEWFPLVGDGSHAVKKNQFYKKEDYYVVIIPFTHFKNYVEKGGMRVQEAIDIFTSVPRIIFESSGGDGAVKLNIGGEWKDVVFTGDNICGVLIASENPSLADVRSVEKELRGRPRKSKLRRFDQDQEKGKYLEIGDREEPVFILVFSNLQGKAYIESARNRQGCRLQYVEMYQLEGRAQELYESVRWRGNAIPVHLDMGFISLVVGWKWPVEGKKKLYRRRKGCQRLIDILYKKGFITKYWITGRGEEIKWNFYIRKVRGKELESGQKEDINKGSGGTE